jgi:hypothetical protein
MKRMLACLALCALVAIACANTLNTSQGITNIGTSGTFAGKVANLFVISGERYNWVWISLVLIVISILINALIYMLARTFQISYLESAFKLELREAVFNIVLILLFGLFALFLDALLAAPLLCDTPVNCVVDTSVSYMDGLIDAAKDRVVSLEKESLKKVSSTNIGGTAGWGGLSIGYVYDMQGLNRVLTLEADEMIKLQQNAALTLIIVKIFLLYFAYYIGPMLIVFGMMLKCFSITRRLGSTMLAIGIGCSIVLPLTIIAILVANGAISIPGVQYMKQADCPDACTTSIVAWNSTGGIDLNEYMDKAQADTARPWSERRGIVTGSKLSLAISGLGTVNSCENQSLSINASMISTYSSSPISININFVRANITTDCPSNCRSIPYPYDIAECRDAERSCAALYAASTPKGACFRKNFDYSNLNYTVVYDGQPMNLSLALNKSACFTVTPLNITAKNSPLDYCPSSCRLFYSDGSTGCSASDPNYFNCTAIYQKATGTTSLAQATAKAKGIYGNITAELGKTSPSAAAITANASVISLPIYPLNHPDCLKIMKLSDDLKSAPTYIDCNGCFSEQTTTAGAKTAEGKFMAYAVMLGIFSIAITLAASVALSMGLEGEMFIPGLERLR